MTTALESPVSGFSHLQLHVSDVTRSERWYEQALGLRRFAGSPEHGYIGMQGAGGRFAIVLSTAPSSSEGSSASSGADARPSSIDHLAFAVRSEPLLAAWAQELREAGIPHDGLVTSGEGISVHLIDPDGLHVELIAPATS